MQDSEPRCGNSRRNPPRKGEETTVQEMGNLVNQAPTSARQLKSWIGLSTFSWLEGTPLWDLTTVWDKYDKTKELIRSGTSAPPLDLLSMDCFTKAGHMTQWYKNTLMLWRDSIEGLDFGPHIKGQISLGLEGALSVRAQSGLLGRLWAFAEFGLMEKFLKWSTATLWANMLHQNELPPVPDFVEKAGCNLPFLYDAPTWTQLCRSTRNACGKKSFSQVVRVMIMITKDMYMTKNASLPVDSTFVEENLEKHKKILCEPKTEDPLSDDMEAKIFLAIQQCADDIFGRLPNQDERKIVKYDETTGQHKVQTTKQTRSIPLEARPPSRLPSLGASVNVGRHLGGAVGDLLKTHGEKYTLPEPEEGYLHSYCTYRTEYIDVRVPHDPELYSECENSSRKAAYARLSVEAQVVPLLEAFKVRTITKGDADQYHLARRWQKVIHGVMRKQTNCRLIGQPCNASILSQTFGNSPYFSMKDKEGFFVSGDYESATDLLHPHLSEVANEAICQRLRIPLEDQWVLKQCLTGHELKYSKKGTLYKQQWGQLMGSPSSFPILCLINLAATKVAYEEYFRSIQVLGEKEYCVLEELPMVVNGDDILYWSFTSDHYAIWKEVTKQCGLKFSLGKNYTHKKVAIINSELYFFKPVMGPVYYGAGGKKEGMTHVRTLFTRMSAIPPNLIFEKISAVNSRLLIGGQRSSGKGISEERDVSYLSDRDLQILAAELRLGKISPVKYTNTELNEIQRKIYNTQTDDLGKLVYLQKLQRRNPVNRTENLEKFLKWRMTVEARGRKGLEMIAGDCSVDCARPALMRAFTRVFNKIQIAKLVDFRKIGLERSDIDTPYFLPQSLGGLGLIPPPDHKFTAMECLEVATLEGCPESAEAWLRRVTPIMPKPDFMKAVSHELSLQKDLLAIKSEYRRPEDIGLLRFLGEEDGFWEHSFLTGFVTQDSMIVDPYELGEAYNRTRSITRSFQSQSLARSKHRQFRYGETLGIWTKVRVDGKSRVERTTAGLWNLEDFNPFDSTLLHRYRPSPKYE